MPKRKTGVLEKILADSDEGLASFSDEAKQIYDSIIFAKKAEALALIQRQEDWRLSAEALIKYGDEVITKRLKRRHLSAVEDKEYKRLRDNERYRLAALNQEKGTAANKERASLFAKALSDFVRGRVRQNSLVKAQELADDAQKYEWAEKNKKHEKYAIGYLVRLIGPLLTKARIDLRAGRL